MDPDDGNVPQDRNPPDHVQAANRPDQHIKFGPHPNLRLHAEKAPIREQLKKYGVAAATTTLDGVTLIPNDWEGLLLTLRYALTLDGKKGFAEGQSPEEPPHWALDASMGRRSARAFAKSGAPNIPSRPFSANDLFEASGATRANGVMPSVPSSGKTLSRSTSPRCTSQWRRTVSTSTSTKPGSCSKGSTAQWGWAQRRAAHRQRTSVEDDASSAVLAGRAGGCDPAQQHQ